jgi:AmmeMemoRadiSam system protein B/AmmeMemoRadiSam system protein A
MKVSNQFFLDFKSGFLVITSALLILCACQSRSNSDASQTPKGESTMEANLKPEDIRLPAVAGSWYSDDPAELRRELEGYLAEAADTDLDSVIGLISPHAGYVYSGPVAAYSYKALKGKQYDVVVVIAPSHVEAFPYAAIYGRGGYQTPFGVIPVDVELANALAAKDDMVKISDHGHRQEQYGRQEHSLEIQLPFLQIVLDDFKIVPIVMGDQSPTVVHGLADALASELQEKNALMVASSDLSHFHPYDEANRIDAGVVSCVEAYDFEQLLTDLGRNKVEACGGGPICAVMEASKKLGAEHSKVLRYANSGDVPYGDKRQVVGYLSAAFYKNSAGGEAKQVEENRSEKLSSGDAKPLSLEDKRTLMDIARTTVQHAVKGERIPHFDVTSPDLLEDRGAFVTLHKHGQLRGCIGYIIGIKPLYQTVQEVAEAAALRDPRFPAVTPEELADLDYEISALSVPRTITDVNEIQVGVHGIIMRRGYHQGLLLPQVATEYGWDSKTFLEHTCMKAGLPTDAWQDEDTEIQIFSAEVFDEEQIK